MRRAASGLAVLAALAAASPAAAAPVRASAGFAPQAVLFGDRLVAHVDVVADPRTVDLEQTTLVAPLGSWTELGPTRVSTTRAGGLARRRWELVLTCRTGDCDPAGASRVARLPAAQLTVVRRDGTTSRLTVSWPPLVVASRLPAGAVTPTTTPFRLPVTPPPPRPSVGASTVETLFGAAAGVLAGIALALVALELRRRRARVGRTVSPLERALALARGAQGRPAADRRRALALLARVATPRDPAFSADVASSAWERVEPEPDRVAEPVRRAERLQATRRSEDTR